MSPKERLIAVLQGRSVDRPPVICPGGMMNAATVEISRRAGIDLPAAHCSSELMAGLALGVREETGFENIGLPFCMTVEAEAMGSRVNMGSPSCEPKIEKEAYSSVGEVPFDDVHCLIESGRAGTVLRAVHKIAKMSLPVPVTGVVTGPLSLAASIVDPMTFFKELRTSRVKAHRVVEHVSGLIVAFSLMMLDAGADVILVADPSASGEILGPTLFEEYAVRYLNRIIDAVHSAHGPVIVHICGDMKSAGSHIGSIRANAVSMDSMMNLPRLKREFPLITFMGNVSTRLLSSGPADRIRRTAKKLVVDGVDIIAPACGLDTHTPLESIRSLTDSVKELDP